jgi:ankyrin repeat protein
VGQPNPLPGFKDWQYYLKAVTVINKLEIVVSLDNSPMKPTLQILSFSIAVILATGLEKGADINLGNQNGVTALMFAAGRGRTEQVQLLLSKGALIDQRDKWLECLAAGEGE